MAKQPMDDLLKRRMSATQRASELQAMDEAYAKLFREAPPAANVDFTGRTNRFVFCAARICT